MDINADDAISFSSKGSTISGWPRPRMAEHDKKAPMWRQLYLSRAKLKAVSRTSALLAGFAMIAMVEVQLDSSVKYPPALLVSFSTVTTCLVSVHLFALMISTCLLPNIEAISNIHTFSALKHSPHTKMRTYIEMSWVLSTGVGLVLFLVEIALLIWLKFYGLCVQNHCNPGSGNNERVTNETQCIEEKCLNAINAGWAAMAILIPVTLMFAGFACHFYRLLAEHKFNLFNNAMQEISDLERRQGNITGQEGNPGGFDGRLLYAQQYEHKVNSDASGDVGIQFSANGHPGEMRDSVQFGSANGSNHSVRSSHSDGFYIGKEE